MKERHHLGILIVREKSASSQAPAASCSYRTGAFNDSFAAGSLVAAAADLLLFSPMGVHPADVAVQSPLSHTWKSTTGCSSQTEARQQAVLLGSLPQSWPAT